jgi:tetratricopeptide (TPR) repeat protein
LASVQDIKPPEIAGISYYYPSVDFFLEARDGKVKIPLGDVPIPVLKEDFSAVEPSYDAIGRGLYHVLRVNPDGSCAQRYAELIRDGYPHLLAELATHLVMLDNKDVDLPYLDRKITYLKIFALLEPHNHYFPLEIGSVFLEKSLSLAALSDATTHLFSAEKYLRRALQLNSDDLKARNVLGEVCYLLGKYNEASDLWMDILDCVPSDAAGKIRVRLDQIAQGSCPHVPGVDYLQAVGAALEAFELSDFEEAAAIILDVIDAVSGFEEFPLAEINYLLGLCYMRLDMPKYAEQYFRQALSLYPGYEEAEQQLATLGVL